MKLWTFRASYYSVLVIFSQCCLIEFLNYLWYPILVILSQIHCFLLVALSHLVFELCKFLLNLVVLLCFELIFILLDYAPCGVFSVGYALQILKVQSFCCVSNAT